MLIALLEAGRVSTWIFAVIIGRELVIMGLRGVIASEGESWRPRCSQVEAAFQFLAIALAILRPGEPIGGLFIVSG